MDEIESETKYGEYGMPDPVNANSPLESKKVTSSITITRRTDRSLMTFILQKILRPLGPLLIKHKEMPPGSPQLPVPKKVSQRCDVVERNVQDFWLYDITPKSASSNPTSMSEKPDQQRKRIYYFAGGGWCMPPSADHWKLLAELVCQTPSTTLTLISYPLVPHDPAPQTFPRLQTLTKTLLQDSQTANERVIFGGDSAGGNIALALPVAALLDHAAQQDANLQSSQLQNSDSSPGTADAPFLPAAIFAMCPSVDLRRKNPAILSLSPRDPLLRPAFITATASNWCSGWDAQDPRMSPLLAPASVFQALRERGVQIHGITASNDILSPDAVLFREKLAEAGVQGKWLDWEKQMHCFPLTGGYGLREGREGTEWIGEVWRAC